MEDECKVTKIDVEGVCDKSPTEWGSDEREWMEEGKQRAAGERRYLA